jgi:hypothetical protein
MSDEREPDRETRGELGSRRQSASGRLLVVRGERLTPELGDARLRARKEERAAGTGDGRRPPELHGKHQPSPGG